MKNLEWTTYGIESEHQQYSESQGQEKKFKVENEHIYFSNNMKFVMDLRNFLVCCCNVQSVPVTNEKDSDEIFVGEEGDYQVYMNRTINHDIGTEEQVGIILRDHGKWYSWIRFTVDELVNIANILDKADIMLPDTKIDISKKYQSQESKVQQTNTLEEIRKTLEDNPDLLEKVKTMISDIYSK